MSDGTKRTISDEDYAAIGKAMGRVQALEDQLEALIEALTVKDALDINTFKAGINVVRLLEGPAAQEYRASMDKMRAIVQPVWEKAGGA